MAIGIYFAPTTMTQQQYFECIKRLKKAGAGHPPGRVYHACFGTGDAHPGLRRLDLAGGVREIRRILMPILQDIGTDPGQPVIMNMHNVITRPAARPRAAAAKRAPAKRAAARRATKKTAKKR